MDFTRKKTTYTKNHENYYHVVLPRQIAEMLDDIIIFRVENDKITLEKKENDDK